jgi:DNA-binding MarR family transcriptional regulator
MANAVLLANMQGVAPEFEQLVRSIAPAANLFLLLSLPELRRQGLTFIAFYALQRTIQESEMTESLLRSETGLKDYEVSRACGFLAKSGLVIIQKAEKDARVHHLKPTARGRRTYSQVLSAAAARFHAGVPDQRRLRQLSEATEAFRTGNRVLLGRFSFLFSMWACMWKNIQNGPGRSAKQESLVSVVPRAQNPETAFWNTLAHFYRLDLPFPRLLLAESFRGSDSARVRAAADSASIRVFAAINRNELYK